MSRWDGKEAFEILDELRKADWTVAVHNDYRLNGEFRTFWLFTHPTGGGDAQLSVKGEGRSDLDALREVAAKAGKVFAPSP